MQSRVQLPLSVVAPSLVAPSLVAPSLVVRSLVALSLGVLSLAGCPAPADAPPPVASPQAPATNAPAPAPGELAAAAPKGTEAEPAGAKPAAEPPTGQPDPQASWKRAPVKGPLPAPPDVKAPPKGTTRTEAGVHIKTLTPGDAGANPGPSSVVTVHYTGWTTDGRMFDSSLKHGEPAQFGLGGVIAGWTDGLQYMTRGEKALLWIPEGLAYKGKPGRPKGMLVFEIELLDFQ